MKKIKLQNFKCFINDEIPLRELTLFTGVNAAGKSSIIQALLLYDKVQNSAKELLDVSDILGIEVGSPKNLISQNAEHFGREDFLIGIDECRAGFFVDKENNLDIYAEFQGDMPPFNVCYLNAERIGPRMFYKAGGSEKFKQDGSNAIYLMERADNAGLELPELLILDSKSKKFSYQVEMWMGLILGEMQLNSKIEPEKAQATLSIKNGLVDTPVIPTLTGFGISYELAVVIAGLWAASQKNTILIVENPEAHLHPSAQSMIGKFLAMIAASGTQVIVETHSEHVIDGARVQMYSLGMTDKVLVNYLSNVENRTKLTELYVDSKGELSDWPDGFFDQKQMDLRELFLLRRKNANHK